MKDFIDFLEKNPFYVFLVIIGLAIAFKECYEFVQWFRGILNKWYEARKNRETKDSNLKAEIEKLKVFVNDDKAQIRGIELHLSEIDEANKKQNQVLENLDESVRELSIQNIRKQILDFYPTAINLSLRPSREAYQECIRNHERYLLLLEQSGASNGYLDYTYGKILDSMSQREQYKLYAENFVLQPSKDMLPEDTEIVEGFEEDDNNEQEKKETK